jgi:hypothetical protein
MILIYSLLYFVVYCLPSFFILDVARSINVRSRPNRARDTNDGCRTRQISVSYCMFDVKCFFVVFNTLNSILFKVCRSEVDFPLSRRPSACFSAIHTLKHVPYKSSIHLRVRLRRPKILGLIWNLLEY